MPLSNFSPLSAMSVYMYICVCTCMSPFVLNKKLFTPKIVKIDLFGIKIDRRFQTKDKQMHDWFNSDNNFYLKTGDFVANIFLCKNWGK